MEEPIVVEQRAALVVVADPGRADDLIAFLRRVDVQATLVDTGSIQAIPPRHWPEKLALVAIERFLAAWCRAHPGAEARIEDPGSLAGGE